jgi:hypothetical protein
MNESGLCSFAEPQRPVSVGAINTWLRAVAFER